MRADTLAAHQHLAEQLGRDHARVAPVERARQALAAGHQGVAGPPAAARKSSGTRTVSVVPVRTAT